MLVLTRKKNQKIVIGDNIIVTVLQVKGNSIQLGIEAPRDVRIMRGELEPFSQKQPARESVTASLAANTLNLQRETRYQANPTHANRTVIGPQRVALPTNLKSPARFPSVMKQATTDAPAAPPLKRYMPATMREVVGNVSV